jgi:hypothetical protein
LGSPERVVPASAGSAAAIARCHPSSATVRQRSSAELRGRGSDWDPPVSEPAYAGRAPFCPVPLATALFAARSSAAKPLDPPTVGTDEPRNEAAGGADAGAAAGAVAGAVTVAAAPLDCGWGLGGGA